MASVILPSFARHLHSLLRKNRSGKEDGSVMFAAIQAVAQADTLWCAQGNDPDLAAEAATGCLWHHDAPCFIYQLPGVLRKPRIYAGFQSVPDCGRAFDDFSANTRFNLSAGDIVINPTAPASFKVRDDGLHAVN